MTGNYEWIPGSSSIPWILLALMLASVGVALGVFKLWGVPRAATAVLLTINDVFHAVGIAWFWSRDTAFRFEKFFSGSYYSIIAFALQRRYGPALGESLKSATSPGACRAADAGRPPGARCRYFYLPRIGGIETQRGRFHPSHLHFDGVRGWTATFNEGSRFALGQLG